MCPPNSFMTWVDVNHHGDNSYGTDDSGIVAMKIHCRYKNWQSAGSFDVAGNTQGEDDDGGNGWTKPPDMTNWGSFNYFITDMSAWYDDNKVWWGPDNAGIMGLKLRKTDMFRNDGSNALYASWDIHTQGIDQLVVKSSTSYTENRELTSGWKNTFSVNVAVTIPFVGITSSMNNEYIKESRNVF